MHLVLSFGPPNHSTYTDIAEQADIVCCLDYKLVSISVYCLAIDMQSIL